MTATFSLTRDPRGRLVLIDAEGNRHVGVEPVRAFPITEPERGVALVDAQGHEVLWIDRVADLPEPIRLLLEEELRRRTFLPVIRKILDALAETEPAEWHVDTDRGQTHFLLNPEEDVRRLGSHRVLITDSHGIRYVIPDVRRLDAASRRLLGRYL